MYFVRYHECGIEAQTEMSDNLVCVALVLVFFNEIRRAGECNLVDVFFHFVGGHAKTVILKGKGLFFRVDDYVNSRFVAFGKLVLSHHIQLL